VNLHVVSHPHTRRFARSGRDMLATAIAVVAIAVTAQSAVSVPFRTIARGVDSKIETRHELVVRTGGTWHLIRSEHRGAFETPEIDFRREMIVAIFAGDRSTHSSSVEIVSVNREEGLLIVRYRVHVDAVPTTAPTTTSPFHIIAVPADLTLVRFVEVPD
jgi:hypothetical protein